MSNQEHGYEGIEERAKEVQQLLANQARRPFVLELTGTPKAGKSSTIRMLESFFKACGWSVNVLRERAELCPIAMKGHFFFNSWTTTTMMAELLAVVDQPVDLVILDRGFFDALVWLELQRTRKQVADAEAVAFTSFVLLDRWRTLVDLTVVMRVDPATAMDREQHGRLVPRRGSLMKEPALNEFNRALDEAKAKYGINFNLLEKTSEGSDQKTFVAELVEALNERIADWADPEIAVVPMQVVNDVFSDSPALSWSDGTWDSLATSAQFQKRSEAEKDESVVQLVACGVPRFSDGVFVFDRTRDKKRLGEYGQHSVWYGQHVERASSDDITQELVRENLVRRMQTNLHLHFDFQPQPLGIVWVKGAEGSRACRHLGVAFDVRIDEQNVAQSLEDKEFKTRGRGHPATSQFCPTTELGTRNLDLESWSKHIVDEWLTKKPEKA